MPALRIIRRLVDLLDVNPGGLAVGDVPTWDGTEFTMDAGGGGGGPPSGPAGGVLSGTYPNPGFAADMATQAELDALQAAAVLDGDGAGGVLSGTYPSPGFAVDMATQAELNTAVSNAVNDGDAAGGVLGGTYPNPSFAADMATQAELDAVNTVVLDHSARHENGGADEISVAGLSGELADAQPITVRKNTGSDVGTRSRINFIEGTNVTLTVTDDAGSDEVDITVAASGGTADPEYNRIFLLMGA